MIIVNYLLVCLIFGTTFLAIKIGVDVSAPPFLSAGIRFFIAGALLFGWMMWRKKASLPLLLHKDMLLTGIGLTFGTFAALYWGEQYVASGVAAVLSATGPMMILILQLIMLRQKPSARSLLGCLAGLFGVFLLIAPSLTLSASLGLLIGSIVIIAGEAFYASGALYSKRVTQRFLESSPIALNAAQMIYGGLLLILLSACTERWHVQSLLSAQALGSLLYLIIIGSMIGHSLFYWLVAKTGPVFASTWLYVSPLVAIAIGVLLYGESVTWMTGIGAITVIAGTVLVNWDSLQKLSRKPRTKEAPLQEAHSRS
ncbi:EamA family transporter [Paenibacillus dendritiformis]|uniref:DMT family transporter n=1 Tax=Paenibacillus dendritiformis TaxID=130049 RepID=UPI00143DCE2A|nr:EamA family transporter [Paenibacillus dendritiformis]NKI21607.1 EamA family transporter [Paenibacillus dendritiformis]NRG01248.1 EamA family transporter [Paenibacillus dendritiformis]